MYRKNGHGEAIHLIGRINYLCSIHPYMTGKIIVAEHRPTSVESVRGGNLP